MISLTAVILKVDMLKDLGSMLNEAVAKSRLHVRGSDQLRSMSKSLIAIFYKEYNTLANGPGTAEHELADANSVNFEPQPKGVRPRKEPAQPEWPKHVRTGKYCDGKE